MNLKRRTAPYPNLVYPAQTRRGGDTAQSVSTALSVVILALLALCAALALVHRDKITPESIASFTPENLWLAALVFMGLFAAKSLTTVVYVKLLYIAAGVVFPMPIALLVNMVGTAVELVLPYAIGRGGGQHMAERTLKRWPKLQRLKDLRSASNFWFAFFSRAVGVIPADPASIYFGACRMPFGAFLWGSWLGMLPTLLITTVMGAAAEDPGSPGFVTAAVLFLLVQAGSALAFALWARHHNQAALAAEKESDDGESAK